EDDNCPQDANPGQEDWDHDGRGWACDFDEHDLDNDHVPNAVDNCPFNANPHQENCNALAETLALFGSDGSVTGDACDPAPCATTKALVSQFVGHSLSPAGSAHNPCLRESGRTIENVLDVRPMRAADFSPVTTDELEVWFCPCEASDAEACADPPWNCAHEHASAQPPGSNWRRITLDAAQPLSTTYEPWVQHPQPSELYTWDYVSDYNAWVIEEQLWTPTPNSVQLYGPGTDMRGILRVDDPTTEGAYAHFFGCADCSLSLHYVADVRPDRATSRLDCMTVPISTAPPYWTYCPECIDGYELPYEHLSYPALFSTVGDDVVLWTNEQPGTEPTGYAMDISDTFSAELRDVMNDERFRIVAPSEPIDSALQPGQTRAFVMTADATTMVGEIDLSEEGFELRHFDAQTPISARSGHATAYSLEADSLFVAGGLENDGTVIPELWQRSVDGDWSRVDLEQHLAPVAAHSAMVSAADRHLWVIDQRGDQLVVPRINPSGQGGQTMRLTSLRNGPAQAWLLQRATGEVLAVVATDSSYEVVHLGYDTRSGRLEVVASARADGEIAAAPIIKNGTLSLGLAHSDDVRSWIEPTDAPRLAARRR
ncbi:MAG: thrombospondin type 3 repeat-containing protein, partial [Nannocystaceae bacterium]|nr:thrombospondin type 3 repeat-containing protein [Nannocystaceae bacterium]